MIPGAESSGPTPPRRWLEAPEEPLPPESPIAWPVDLLQSAGTIEVPIVRKQRMFLRLGYARSHQRLGWPRAVVLAPGLLLLGAAAAAAFTGLRVRAPGFAQPIACAPGGPRADEPAATRRSELAATLDDPSLVLAAVRALRVEHDPQRARVLVASYLQAHPAGSLAEEALAVDMEAAVDHQDPDAALLGAEYLSQYPNGAFRGLAQRTVTRRDRR